MHATEHTQLPAPSECDSGSLTEWYEKKKTYRVDSRNKWTSLLLAALNLLISRSRSSPDVLPSSPAAPYIHYERVSPVNK